MQLPSPVARRAELGFGSCYGVVLGTAKEALAALELRAPESQFQTLIATDGVQ